MGLAPPEKTADAASVRPKTPADDASDASASDAGLDLMALGGANKGGMSEEEK